MGETIPSPVLPSSPAVCRTARTSFRDLAIWTLIVVLVGILFARLFIPVEAAWRTDSNYSHGYLIPVLCIFLGFRAWNRAGIPSAGDRNLALFTLIPGGLLLLLATVIPWPLITFAALALILRGITVAVGGRTWAAHYTAPILFTFFMFPVPVTWTSTLALWLQDVVSRLSAACLEPFVISMRTGTKLHLVGAPHPLQVGEQCSGLRQLVGFLAFAVLLGLLMDRPGWLRLLLVALAIPFAVLANVVRVLLMCLGAVKFGSGWMDGWLHHAPAAFTLPVGFGMLLGVDYVLGRWAGSTPVPMAGATSGPSDVSRNLRPVAICLGLFLVAQAALLFHLRASGPESFPLMRAPLAEIPTELADGWAGIDRADLDSLRGRLPYTADDLLLREYHYGAGGPMVQVYAAYSKIGEDRKHHPEICIREVTGAPEDLAARAKIPLDPEHKRQVQRFVFRTGTSGRTTVYYWHYTLRTPEMQNSFLQTLHQRLGQSAPSLTIQVSTGSANPEELKFIENQLLPEIDTALRSRQLPASATIDTTRLPVTLLRD